MRIGKNKRTVKINTANAPKFTAISGKMNPLFFSLLNIRKNRRVKMYFCKYVPR